MRYPQHWYEARLQNVDVTRAYLEKMPIKDIEELIEYEVQNSQRLRTLNVLHARLYKRKRKESWDQILLRLLK